MTFSLYSCHRLRATISKVQCGKNRQQKLFACGGCPGLPADPVGEIVQTVSPKEAEAEEIPTVTLKFSEPEDRELYRALKTVCSDLGYDIISLLHLACRGDFSKAAAKARG